MQLWKNRKQIATRTDNPWSERWEPSVWSMWRGSQEMASELARGVVKMVSTEIARGTMWDHSEVSVNTKTRNRSSDSYGSTLETSSNDRNVRIEFVVLRKEFVGEFRVNEWSNVLSCLSRFVNRDNKHSEFSCARGWKLCLSWSWAQIGLVPYLLRLPTELG